MKDARAFLFLAICSTRVNPVKIKGRFWALSWKLAFMSYDTPPSEEFSFTAAVAKRETSWRTIILRVVSIGVGGYLFIVLVMMFYEEQLIFFPNRYPVGDWKPAGLTFEDAHFQSADGTKLHGWFLPHETPKAVVLFAPGNAGNVTIWADVIKLLCEERNVSVMIFDYRGYGRSQGSPSETGILADARAARAWLAKRAAVAEKEIVLLGRSLGGSVMVDLASKDGARGLILESTFTSIPDVAAVHYPWLPVRLMMRTRLDSLSKIGDYHGPLLQSHGDRDEIIPYEMGRRLFEAANEPKTFVTLRGGGHNDPQTPEFYQALDRFLGELPSTKKG